MNDGKPKTKGAKRSLKLRTETLAQLTNAELEAVQGGTWYTSATTIESRDCEISTSGGGSRAYFMVD